MKNPISLDGLVSWLEQQDPATRYDFCDPYNCLLCRYFKAIGLPLRSAGTSSWTDTSGQDHLLPWVMTEASVGNSTYGGALAHTLELLAHERAA